MMAAENNNQQNQVMEQELSQTTLDLGNKIEKLSQVVEKLGELIKEDLLRTGSSSIPIQKSKTIKQPIGVKQKITHFISDSKKKEIEEQEDLERAYPDAHKCELCQKHYCSLQRLQTHKKYKHKDQNGGHEKNQKTKSKWLFLKKKEKIL